MEQAATAFERIADGNVDALAEQLSSLDEAVRGRWRDPSRCVPAYWRWCYVNNPVGRSGAGAALDGDRVLAKAGSVYLRVSVDGQEALAALSEGVAALPEARSWHVYRGLVECCWRAGAEDGVRFGFAFATPSAAELNRALGWPLIGPVPVWMGVVDLARALRARSIPLAGLGALAQPWLAARSPARPAEMVAVTGFDTSHDDLWSTLAPARPVCVVKDARYLEWRYRACPGRSHECWAAQGARGVEGLLVFRLGRRNREAYLLELLARNDDVECLRAMVAWLLQRLRGMGVGLVRASYPAHSAEAMVLREAGLRCWPGWPPPMSLLLAGDAQTEASAGRIASWYFSLGDWLYH